MRTPVTLLLELGLILAALSVLGAVARHLTLSPVPLYLLAGWPWARGVSLVLLAVTAIDGARAAAVLPLPEPPAFGATPAWYQRVVIAVTVLVAVLSYWPIRNLLSRHQVMNYSFNPLHLVNTYGAFGGIERIRHEVVIEGTDEPEITDDTVWKEYDFRGKPGAVRRLPPQVAPYHLRFDWMMRFAAISPTYAIPWFAAFLVKLLDNDPVALKLVRRNPFPASPPTFLRARLYRYRFADRHELRHSGAWWQRTLVGDYVPPVMKAPPARSRPGVEGF
ncbi:lipase maturation factor family protein [Streptomyces sp. ISL-100]|uniref:lipase maturation factor family protein n=1 Tax=Streptomyces sp. ISL-100 TaxID=2819173 RepID=UPI0027E522C8|nr:lipase maturation factor family protein [Streptomyces sp. ISL-100]